MSRLEPKLQRSLGISMGAHAAMLICAVWLARQAPATPPAATERVPSKLIYFERSDPMGGGGGTSKRAAPAKLEIPRQQPPPPVTAVPVQTVEPPPPVPTLKLQVQTDAASVLRSPGTNISLPPGRAGAGKGAGVGEGDGPGLNKGTGGEQGDGPMLPGGDVTSPDVLKEIRPAYTAGALAAKLQGTVELEIVVRADGSVGDVKITRSLDRVYGLDLEAIKAARQWVFRPGTHKGKPVDVIARLQLQFRIF